jgi:hypothetical protein
MYTGILKEEMEKYVEEQKLAYTTPEEQSEAQKAFLKDLREKAEQNNGTYTKDLSSEDKKDLWEYKIEEEKLVVKHTTDGSWQTEEFNKNNDMTRDFLLTSLGDHNEKVYNYQDDKLININQNIKSGGKEYNFEMDASGKYILSKKEKDYAEKEGLNIDTLTDGEVIKIKDAVKEEENKEQKEEKPNLNVKEENYSSGEENHDRYENPEAEAIFRKYAAEKGYDFTINENDTEALSGEFSKDGIGKGRVRVKDDSATSDIDGIEALVYYAKEKEMSITLGSCSPEYKAKMEELCHKNNIELLYAQPALEEHKEKTPLEEGGSNSETDQIDVEENKGMEMPTYEINQLKAQVDLKKYLRDAAKDGETFHAVLEGKAENYKEGLYDDLGPEVKEKACADILLRQYAAAFVKGESDEKLQNLEMALKMYGLESISIDPKQSEGKVTITTKNFKEREAEEMAQIKTCHDSLVPSKKVQGNTGNKGNKKQQDDHSSGR